MKTFSVILTCALTLGAVQAQAATPETDVAEILPTTTVSNTADVREATTKPTNEAGEELAPEIIAAITISVIGVVAAALGVGYWAIQQRIIPNPLPGIIPGPPEPPAPSAPAPEPAPALEPAPVPPAAEPAPAPAPQPAPQPAPSDRYYSNCRDVWNTIGRPIHRNDPGYRPGLDRDGDGVGCEKRPR
ncbi:excalibur calcium-binding domain-containing protein [Corynebacterium glucuronolyticum]|uniref:excalibur calcium-binding domain-containing protein n=1 Tax=Corynebacterium glucuronolyticum TaxID=39791 RepID=UPI00191DB792|nr:excalibur calcium-binding domain-containing protein [Corynebacterium glucuronolyticum]QQU89070.1 excalibur calcium-binding domain-containing protein [Corynebacterium glucuronolyticum]